MDVIAFVNKKGGVGKSSCVMHLGGSLAHRGKRVLWVDVDPQASLAQGLIGPAEALGLHPRQTLAGLYDESYGSNVRQIIRRFDARPNLALIPGHDRMTHFNVPDPWTTGADQYLLRDALDEVAHDFDIALLDCPPNIQACAWAALVAADFVVVPAQVEDYGVQGVSMILDSIDHARAVANPRLRLLGFLPTMVVKTLSIHTNYTADLRAAYGTDVFESVVPAAKDFKEAVTLRKTVVEYKPKSAASKAIEAVADELLARVAAHRQGEASERSVA